MCWRVESHSRPINVAKYAGVILDRRRHDQEVFFPKEEMKWAARVRIDNMMCMYRN